MPHLETLYTILYTWGMLGAITEIYGKIKEGLVMLKHKSAKGQARTSKLLSLNAVTSQTLAILVGFFLGHNNIIPLLYLCPLVPIYAWLTYLCFKYKRSKFNPFVVR